MAIDVYNHYLSLLREELIPALGCTEPIAIAYVSALAAHILGGVPDRMTLSCSGNIIKNVKGVVVPNTGSLKGLEVAAAVGAVGGDHEKGLEVLAGVTPEDVRRARELIAAGALEVKLADTDERLYIEVAAARGEDRAVVVAAGAHTNITRVEKNGKILHRGESLSTADGPGSGGFSMTVRDILRFADTVKLEDIEEIVGRQIEYNTAISNEGLSRSYGACVGRVLLEAYGQDVRNRAKAKAAAGSDARMSGCDMPVIVNSGSGNQGMAASLPVIEYAAELGADRETLHRALVVSNLTAIHLKTGIGKLSAFCGAVCAACGSGAAITYLYGGGYDQVSRTITNTLANVSGMVCDGAKPSCAAKVASAVDAAILAHSMTMQEKTFEPGDGIVKDDVERTIASIGELAREGMEETDETLLKIMIREE